MSTKRIKFLERKKILQEHIRIQLETLGRVKRFTVDLELSSYGFPSDSVVFVEAKTLLETMRFDLGTIGGGLSKAPKGISKLESERITFNVLVVDPKTARKLGSAETIRPVKAGEEPTGAQSLLPVDLAEDTGGLVWTIRFEDADAEGHSDAPILVLNKAAAKGSAAVFVQEAAFRAMVFPAAFQQVLTRILLVDEHEYAEDSGAWRDLWLRFAASLVDEAPPERAPDEHSSELQEWVQRAVRAFAERNAFLDAFIQETLS